MASAQRRTFDRAIEAWNTGDLSRYLDLHDERIALHGYSDAPMGKAEVRGFYEQIFAAFSDIVLEIHEVVEDGSQLGCRFTMHGTHRRDGRYSGDRAADRPARDDDPAL